MGSWTAARRRVWLGAVTAYAACAAVIATSPLAAQGPVGEPRRPDLWSGDRASLGLTAGLAIPTGEFRGVAGLGFELTAHLLLVNSGRWLGLRVSGSGAIYRAVSSPVTNVGRLSAGNRMATLDLGPQILAPRGVVRPYGYATLGGTFAVSDPSIEGWVDPLFQPPTYSDVTYVLEVGGGLYVPLTAGERSISLDLGAHFRRNGATDFLRVDGIALAQPNQLSLNPSAVGPKLVVLSLGVVVGL